MQRQVGELFDGGYWFVTETVSSPNEEGNSVPLDGGWCATYVTVRGTRYAAVRTPSPVSLPDALVTVQEVLEAAAQEGSQATTEKHPWRVEGK